MGNCVEDMTDPSPNSSGIDVTTIVTSELPIIFILGGPGAGKRTLCAKVAEKYDFVGIMSSDLLRTEIATRTERALHLARFMSQGKLVPQDVLLELIKVKMLDHLHKTKGFILTGFPRDKGQCRLFEKHVRPPDLVLYLSVRNSLLRDRIMARRITITERPEPSTDEIKKRIKESIKMNKPLLKYYRKSCMVQIDGEKDIECVFEDVCKIIDNILKDLPTTPLPE